MLFKTADTFITVLPKLFVGVLNMFYPRQFPFQKQLRVYFGDQHIFVMRAGVHPDPAELRQPLISPPQKVVLQFFMAWLLKAKNRTAFGVKTAKGMLDGPVLPGRIHGLENDQYRKAVI